MKAKSLYSEIGTGATDELSLRVSVATLVRVLFHHPNDGKLMLALERKATLLEEDDQCFVDIKAQPFGGAIYIHDTKVLQDFISEFHFDSEGSRAGHDFRLFIRPSDWETIREFCLQQFSQMEDSVLESDPEREIAEEFAETLGINIRPDQYIYQPVGTILENDPFPTENFHARGYATVRIYRTFEARILDPAVIAVLLENSENCSDENLRELTLQDSQQGKPGRANAVLTLPFREINDFYTGIPLEARNQPVFFQNHQLDETVAAVLEGVTVPKYRKV